MTHSGVAVRDAATVMLLRDGDDGPEVLLVRRTNDAVFAAGAHVFPGGAVDIDDHRADLAAHLGIAPDDADAAWRVAALREAFEEAGLLLVDPAQPPPDPDRLDALRRALLDGSTTLPAICAGDDVRPSGEGLRFVARWVTPPGGPRRFDTRFFVAPAPAGQEPCHDESETVDCAWFRPRDAIDAYERGEVDLIMPTLCNLALLARFDSVGSVLDALDGADIDDRIAESEFGWRVRLPGEPDLDDEGVA